MSTNVLIGWLAIVTLLIGLVVFIAVTFRKSLMEMIDAHERERDSSAAERQALINRIMARSYEEYKIYDQNADQRGGFEAPTQSSPAVDMAGRTGAFVQYAGPHGEAVPYTEEPA